MQYNTKGAATWASDDGSRLVVVTANDVVEIRPIPPTNTEADLTGRFQFVGPSTRILVAQNGGVAVARADSGRVDNLAFCRSWGTSFEDFGQVTDLTELKIISTNGLVLLANGRVYTKSRRDEMVELRPQNGSSTNNGGADAAIRGENTALEVDPSGNAYVATYDGTHSRVFRFGLSRGEPELLVELPAELSASSIGKLAWSRSALYGATADGRIVRIARE